MMPDKCPYCGEGFGPGDEINPGIQAAHTECCFRAGAGSLAHLQGRCSCFVAGSDEGDPPEMTKRQAARAALEYFRGLSMPAREALLTRPLLSEGGDHAYQA
jgi:hypothetical protein